MMGQFNLCDIIKRKCNKYLATFKVRGLFSEFWYVKCMLYLNLHLTFTFYILSFISYMVGAESPGERTGDFPLLDQANSNFLEKETCKL